MNEELWAFLDYVDGHHQKHELASTIEPYSYDPGNTENLEQFEGLYFPMSGKVILSTEVKGLRYENRSRHLESVSVGDTVELRRDKANPYNSNNFELFTSDGRTLGSLSAELCNRLAPLYDTGRAEVTEVKASYIEQFDDRSRYVKQGVLFVKLTILVSTPE